MSHKIKFTKMQSIGNDFMLVDDRYNNIDYIKPNIVKQLSCRNTGIGFDQLLILDNNNNNDNVFSYSILNADGSKAKQCINGMRAIAQYIFNKYNIQDAIIKNLSGKYSAIKSDLDEIKLTISKDIVKIMPWTLPINLKGQKIAPSYIDIGNMHAVICSNKIEDINLSRLAGNIYEETAHECNVSVYELVTTGKVVSRTQEIGSGETASCGSGALAIATSYFESSKQDQVIIAQQGGTQSIALRNNDYTITASATEVYTGEVNLLSYRCST